MSTASILMVHLVYPHNYYLSLQPQSRKLLTVFNTHRQGMLVWIIEHSIPCTFTSIHITAIRVMITQDGYVFKGKIILELIRKQILPKPWQMISPYQGSPCQYMRVLRDTMSVRNAGKRIGFCDHRRRHYQGNLLRPWPQKLTVLVGQCWHLDPPFTCADKDLCR